MVNLALLEVAVSGFVGFLGSLLANWYFRLPSIAKDPTVVSERKWAGAMGAFIILIGISVGLAFLD